MRFYLVRSLWIALSLASASVAFAQYPSAKPNSGVREEIQGDPNRLIPTTEHFAFAADGEAYYRNLGAEDFYHGMGYWLQVRTEARTTDAFHINLRSIFYAGSCSQGYAQPTGSYHLLSLTAVMPGEVLGGKVTARGPDLDRQTFGDGLVIQDKEMNGFLGRWERDSHLFLFRVDGTGLLRQPDDTYNWEASLYGQWIGTGLILWPQGVEQDHLDHERASYYYVFSRHRFDWIGYGAEYGDRGGAMAGMVDVNAQREFGPVAVQTKLEARRYNAGFAADFAGQIQQQYISYDQYDKDFTNAANVFVVGDDVNVGAVHLNLWWKISHTWRLHSLNEVGKFDYRTHDPVSYYYFRQGIEYCPNESRDDCLNLFASNKVLSDSYTRPPADLSLSDTMLFKTVPFIGVEARFRL